MDRKVLQWTHISLMNEAVSRLKSVNIGDAERNVEWIFCELLNCNRAHLYANPNKIIPTGVVTEILSYIERRINHEPLQYILGYTEFYGLRFEVSPAVLIPRPETELLVEIASTLLKDILEDVDAPAVLDLGTGSGCIPVSIKHLVPQATVMGCDISDAALQMARKNAANAGLDVDFFKGDILSPSTVNFSSRPLDVITSNPPYIPEKEYQTLDTEVKNFEPGLALTTGDDPLKFYKALATIGQKNLRSQGILLVETHCDYANDVATLFEKNQFIHTQVIKDLTGRNRFVQAQKR